MKAPGLGTVNRNALLYGRQDVRATYALFKALRSEYRRHPFATFANERRKPKLGRYMGQLYSSASIAKQYLRLLGIAPLLQKQPRFNRRYLGYASASYFGGRADVRVRKRDITVRVADYTAMYPTIFCLQRLDKLLTAPEIKAKVVTAEIKPLVGQMASHSALLFEPKTWTKFNCLVLIDPQWAVLPVRMCENASDPYTIAVTPIDTSEGRWYTLADVLASVLFGQIAPRIRRAIRFVPSGRRRSKTVRFRNAVDLRSNGPFFKTIVEQRQIAKRNSSGDRDLAALEAGLKQLAAGGAYGIYAEVNVQPAKSDDDLPGDVYADIAYFAKKVHDERPGAFNNPLIASLVTGGARLMLALLEREVMQRGGAFAFCDTDSLAITCSDRDVSGIPSISEAAIEQIVQRFDLLNPYDPKIVPHLLKIEYPGYSDLRCFAVSAKRYVLYRMRPGDRIQIVKASESALGAIIGRSRRETTAKLARRVWLSILMEHLPVNPKQRHRARVLIDFDVPLRRKFPIGQTAIYRRLERYNEKRSYDHKVKPFGFVQTVALAARKGSEDPLPIAPFETDLVKARRLPWVDFNTGQPVQLDWAGSAMYGTLEVMRLSEYVAAYQRHPEAKAADGEGNPAGPETTGLLGRLRVKQRGKLRRIGKEVDRLDEDEGASLAPDRPTEYERDDLADDINYLSQFTQRLVAKEIGISERRWRDIAIGKTTPRKATAARIARVTSDRRGRSLSARR
jgi:hypothetical protein